MTLTITSPLADTVSLVLDAIDFVKGLTDTELGEAQATANAYIQEQFAHRCGSILTQECADLLGWTDEIAVNVLLDGGQISDTLGDLIRMNELEGEADAELVLAKHLTELKDELFCVQTIYQRIRN